MARDGGHAEGRAPRRWGLAVVRGRSMQPTLNDGDRLLVQYGRAPRPGGIAVVRLPERNGLSIKRIAWSDSGGWWIQRDNPAEGVDSWQVGPIPPDGVVAVALVRVWPRPRLLNRSRGIPRADRGTPADP
jgi:nickel-type superoxide dismutase maturation protease